MTGPHPRLLLVCGDPGPITRIWPSASTAATCLPSAEAATAKQGCSVAKWMTGRPRRHVHQPKFLIGQGSSTSPGRQPRPCHAPPLLTPPFAANRPSAGPDRHKTVLC